MLTALRDRLKQVFSHKQVFAIKFLFESGSVQTMAQRLQWYWKSTPDKDSHQRNNTAADCLPHQKGQADATPLLSIAVISRIPWVTSSSWSIKRPASAMQSAAYAFENWIMGMLSISSKRYVWRDRNPANGGPGPWMKYKWKGEGGTWETPADAYVTQGQPTMREQGYHMNVLVAWTLCTHQQQSR